MKDIKLAIIFGILFLLAVYLLCRPGAEQVAEPAGEYVSGEAIAEEKAKEEWPTFKLFSAERAPLKRGVGTIERNVHIQSLDGPTLGDMIDRIEVLEKTIAACCGTQYIDPDAEQNLTVMVMLRKKVMELEARILALEHR